MSSRKEVTIEAALAAKAEVRRRLEEAPELFEGVRSIGVGWGRQGDRCVRVTAKPEALDGLRQLIPERIDGVAVELLEGGPIRAQGARFWP